MSNDYSFLKRFDAFSFLCWTFILRAKCLQLNFQVAIVRKEKESDTEREKEGRFVELHALFLRSQTSLCGI